MSSITREARRDAAEYARAQMFFGEGAGTRRKLIAATVDAKADRDPRYARVFFTELGRQDMAEHALKARHERNRIDKVNAFKRNTRALATGNIQNAQTGILILAVGGYVAHQMGWDKLAYEKGRELYYDAKARVQKYRANHHNNHLRSVN